MNPMNVKKCWGVEELFLAIEGLEMLGATYNISKVLDAGDSPFSLFEVSFTFPEVVEPVFDYD